MSKTFYDKPLISNRNGAAELYSFTVGDNDRKITKVGTTGNQNGVGCSLSEDYIVTYAYELLFTNGPDKRIPYVVCDYVE
jgi:hypothetical protein